MPSVSSSPQMHGAPHSRLSRAISRISLLYSSALEPRSEEISEGFGLTADEVQVDRAEPLADRAADLEATQAQRAELEVRHRSSVGGADRLRSSPRRGRMTLPPYWPRSAPGRGRGSMPTRCSRSPDSRPPPPAPRLRAASLSVRWCAICSTCTRAWQGWRPLSRRSWPRTMTGSASGRCRASVP